MDESKFFKLITDNNIIYNFDYMSLTDYPAIIFNGMKLIMSNDKLKLFYNVDNNRYRSSTNIIRHIKDKWNSEVNKHNNINKLIDKL